MGQTSTATPLFLDMSLATGWRGRANPWPMRDVLNKRASNRFWSTSVPSRSAWSQETWISNDAKIHGLLFSSSTDWSHWWTHPSLQRGKRKGVWPPSQPAVIRPLCSTTGVGLCPRGPPAHTGTEWTLYSTLAFLDIFTIFPGNNSWILMKKHI